MEDVPLAFGEFQGRLLVGVGNLLRIYELGKKRLLKKCENKVVFVFFWILLVLEFHKCYSEYYCE